MSDTQKGIGCLAVVALLTVGAGLLAASLLGPAAGLGTVLLCLAAFGGLLLLGS